MTCGCLEKKFDRELLFSRNLMTQQEKRKFDAIGYDTDEYDEYSLLERDIKKRKLVHVDETQDLDLIRALPIEVRFLIFSYLNWKQAVGLQVVSSTWFNETLHALEVLNLKEPSLVYLRKTHWLLKHCPNIRSFVQFNGMAQGLDLRALKTMNRLSSLHLSSVSGLNQVQLIGSLKHTLKELTTTKETTDLDLRGLCQELSRGHLTKLGIQSDSITNTGLHYVSLLTDLQGLTVADSRIINDLRGVTSKLRKLTLDNCKRITSMDLKAFPYLESLEFLGTPQTITLQNTLLCTKLTQLLMYGQSILTVPIDHFDKVT